MVESVNTALDSVAHMQSQLNALKAGQLRAGALGEWVQHKRALLDALPPPFTVVLQDLLNRLEAGALFTEESCSFSQKDLHDSLQLWIDKAESYLRKSGKV
ncbi:hypothetical protein E9531_10795 [Lampropedia puyangensis]|uniref:Uncharacterized protein n=1 Tax=Lampropedia puyangensis TaxID=1330072 RepID=A0A4S8F045_9BURK|nr:hypothetical protein [Lampropedia puyangensis]THU00247.1 hypothetical protein E9531_10795 [Lampropedia puyangensis]